MTVANDAVDSSDQWIKAIATVVSQKAVAEWSDEDLTRYRVTVPTHIAAFYRLMALHADNRAEGLGAFASRRVTFTTSDGRENHRLVSFDESDRPAVEAAMQDAIEALAVALGSPTKAQHALLQYSANKYFRSSPQTYKRLTQHCVSPTDTVALTIQNASND